MSIPCSQCWHIHYWHSLWEISSGQHFWHQCKYYLNDWSNFINTHMRPVKFVHFQLNYLRCIIQKSPANSLSRWQNIKGGCPHHPKLFNYFWILIHTKSEVGWNHCLECLSLHCSYLTWAEWHINSPISMAHKTSLCQFFCQQQQGLIKCAWSVMFCTSDCQSWGCGCIREFC